MGILQKAKDFFWDFLDWHEDTTEALVDKLNISWYGATWIAFAKGILVVLILQWLF